MLTVVTFVLAQIKDFENRAEAEMKASRTTRAPAYLTGPAKQFWRDVTSLYQFEDHELHLLRLACDALQDAEACRETVVAEGRFTKNRYGCVVEHPALIAGLKARTQFAAIVKQFRLGEDEMAKGPVGRPPQGWQFGAETR